MQVKLYSSNCPKCRILKQKLTDSKIEFEEENDVQTMLNMGLDTMPILGVDDRLLSFGEAIKWIGEQTNND
jgi:glutaredoxin-related protein